jgi:hypothetical protein
MLENTGKTLARRVPPEKQDENTENPELSKEMNINPSKILENIQNIQGKKGFSPVRPRAVCQQTLPNLCIIP